MATDPPRVLYEGRARRAAGGRIAYRRAGGRGAGDRGAGDRGAGDRGAGDHGGRGRIVVTEQWCDIDGDRYAIAELDRVGTTRGERRAPGGRRLAGLVGLGTALVLTVVAIGSGWTRDVWPAVAVAAVGTVAIAFAPVALGAVLRRPYEIWASCRGADVRLFVTDDAEQHGQVARALVRARELHGL